MARHVFFSFKYNPDVWRVNALRNQGYVLESQYTQYWDNSLNERSWAQNPEYIKRKIREGLKRTSVTVMLITPYIFDSEYVKYEYEKSIEMGNKILQLDVSDMKDQHGNTVRFTGWLPYVDRGLRKKWYPKCPSGKWIEDTYQRG